MRGYSSLIDSEMYTGRVHRSTAFICIVTIICVGTLGTLLGDTPPPKRIP